MRKDGDVIQKMLGRCIDLGERRIIARRETRGGGGHVILTGVIHRSFNPTKVIRLSGRPGKSRVMTTSIWSSIMCILAMQNPLSVIGIGLGVSEWGFPSSKFNSCSAA
jgi:hypothetical protein